MNIFTRIVGPDQEQCPPGAERLDDGALAPNAAAPGDEDSGAAEVPWPMNATAFLQVIYGHVRPDLAARVEFFALPSAMTYFGGVPDATAFAAECVEKRENAYFGVCPVREGIAAPSRGKAEDAVAIPGFIADFDLAKHGISEDQALEILANRCPEPTIIVRSSDRGWHTYWLFEQVWELSSKEENLRAAVASKAFAAKFDSVVAAVTGRPTDAKELDKVADLARVLRLPGSKNFNPMYPDSDVTVYDAAGPRHKRDELVAWAGTAPARASAQRVTSSAMPPYDILALIRATLAAAPPSPEVVRVLRGEPIAPIGMRDSTLTSTALSVANAFRRIRHDDVDYYLCSDGKKRSAVAFARNRVLLAEADPARLAPLFGASLAAANDVSDPGPTIVDAEAKLLSALAKVCAERDIGTVGAERRFLGWMEKIAKKSKPHIVVGTNVEAVGDAVESALSRLGREEPQHALYVRGDVLVDVTTETSTDAVTITHPPNAPRIRALPLPALVETMSRAATFSEERRTKKGSYEVSCWPPERVAKVFEARGGRCRLPRLAGIIETPALVANGRIIDTPGYDVASQLLYLPSIVYPSVPEYPTQADARHAIDEMLEPMCDIPFASGHVPETSHYRSAAAAFIFTMLTRHGIAGPVPAFPFSSPVPGSGKGLATSIATSIGLGRPATTATLINDEAEMDKRLLAIALSGSLVVIFDDLPNGVLGTSSLSRALTDYSGHMEGRLLGESRWIRAPLKAVFAATGVNISYQHTLARRVVQCVIDPRLEKPETRSGWRYPDVLGHVAQHRARLVVCALTVLRAHFLAGRPQHTGDAFGSFEAWDRIVRSAIIWTGLADPCGGSEAIRVQADADLELLRPLVAAWQTLFGSQLISIGTAITKAQNGGIGAKWLLDALSAIDDRLRPAQIGQALGRWRDRVVDGLRFESIFNKSNKVQEWRVVPVSPAGAAASSNPVATATPVATASVVLP